ncbi:MAG: response regulator [Archangium sp.]
MRALRMLVVDDDPDVRELMSQLLELEGHQVQGAADGREALAWLRRGPRPDAILLDLRMPGMNGWEFRAAQLAEPELASIPVYVLTADRTSDVEDIRALQAAGFFHKPLDVDVLLDTLGHLQPLAASAPLPTFEARPGAA